MKKNFTLAFLLFVTICLKRESVVSWKELEGSLARPTDLPWRIESYMKNPFVKDAMDSKSESAFLEMSYQYEFPTLVLVGFLAVENLNSNRAFELSHRILMEEDKINPPLLAPIEQCLTNHLPQKVFDSVFEQTMKKTPRHQNNLDYIFILTPLDMLDNWFNAAHIGVRPSSEARLLTILFERYDETHRKPSLKMQETIIRLGLIPGEPRLTFLLFAPEESKNYSSFFRATIESEETSEVDLRRLLRKKHQYCAREIKVDNIKVGAKRLELIKRYLEKK